MAIRMGTVGFLSPYGLHIGLINRILNYNENKIEIVMVLM